MKDFIQIWNRVAGKSYSSVNQHDREMRDLSHNRLRPGDIDTSTFEANFAECEGLNTKFNDEGNDFNDRKDAIINRLFEQRKKGQVARQPKNLFILLMLGFFGLAAGCFILIAHPYDVLFKLKVVLSDGGEIYEMWRKPEVDVYLRVYLFNVTNAEAFMAGKDSKLKLEEVGPYVYKENLEHKNVTFNHNGTLSAVPVHPLTWVGELSEGRLETDRVIMPNIALLSITHVTSKSNFFTRMGLNTLIGTTGSQPLVEMTAREFMFGYESSILTLGNTFMPGWIKFDKLGLIDRMYDFEGDYETVFTGADDVTTSGLLDTYRGSTDLPQWDGKHCSNVQYASDGTKFKGNIQQNESILFFRKSLCRSAPLIAVDQDVKSGLHGKLFTFPDDMLDNGKVNPDNKCFCRKGNCLPDGLIDVTDCYYGFPIALSYPHFYKGEERLFRDVAGLTPNKENHTTEFWIEPVSGLPLEVTSKIQINMALNDVSSMKNVDKFANMYLPLLWFDIRMYQLPTSMAERFKLYLNVLPIVEQGAMYILFVIGAILVLVAVYRLAFKIMFKTFDHDKKHTNIILGAELWNTNEKTKRNNKRNNKEDMAKNGIYAPCEVALNDSDDSDEMIKTHNDERRPSGIIKTHADRIKELGAKLNDKVYDSVGSIKEKIREIPNVKQVFDEARRSSTLDQRRGSLLDQIVIQHCNTNDAFKSDDDDDDVKPQSAYNRIHTYDSDDECKYLEVLDDGSAFDEMMKQKLSDRRRSEFNIQRMNNLDNDGDDDLIGDLTDLKIDL